MASDRTLSTGERARRMAHLLFAMAELVNPGDPETFAARVARDLRKTSDSLDDLTPEQLASLLDLLEDRVPTEFRQLLEEAQ